MKHWNRMQAGVGVVLLGWVGAGAAQAQSGNFPAKPGLWEVQSTSTSKTALPPDMQAKIDAMPKEQQDMMRQMMAGRMPGGAGAPVSTTRQVCIAPNTNLDEMLNRAQQNPAMKCTFSNRTRTSTGASFDLSCTSAQGSATGHAEYKIADDSHATSATHMTVTMAANGRSMTSTVDANSSSKFVSADCGDVKPMGAPPARPQ